MAGYGRAEVVCGGETNDGEEHREDAADCRWHVEACCDRNSPSLRRTRDSLFDCGTRVSFFEASGNSIFIVD